MIKVFLAMTAVAAVVCAPVAWADTFVLGGTGAVGAPTQGGMAFLITDGIVEPDTMVGIDYPAQLWPLFGATTFDDSVLAGTYTLDYAINHAAGPATVVGISLGAVVINYEKRRLIAAYDPPFDITFVTLGDPTNADGGLLAKLPPVYIPVLDFTITPPPVDTPYDTVEVVREFDGFADVPDHLFNWIANLNALAGVIYVHPDYGGLDLNDPDNVITSTTNSLGGTTTHILVATDNLPLTQPLRDLGVDDRLVDAIDRILRRIINAAYHGPRPGKPAPATRPVRGDVANALVQDFHKQVTPARLPASTGLDSAPQPQTTSSPKKATEPKPKKRPALSAVREVADVAKSEAEGSMPVPSPGDSAANAPTPRHRKYRSTATTRQADPEPSRSAPDTSGSQAAGGTGTRPNGSTPGGTGTHASSKGDNSAAN
jgi:hypothetical protein